MVVKRVHKDQHLLFRFHSDGERVLRTGVAQALLWLRNQLPDRRDDRSFVGLSISLPPGHDQRVFEALSAFAAELTS